MKKFLTAVLPLIICSIPAYAGKWANRGVDAKDIYALCKEFAGGDDEKLQNMLKQFDANYKGFLEASDVVAVCKAGGFNNYKRCAEFSQGLINLSRAAKKSGKSSGVVEPAMGQCEKDVRSALTLKVGKGALPGEASDVVKAVYSDVSVDSLNQNVILDKLVRYCSFKEIPAYKNVVLSEKHARGLLGLVNQKSCRFDKTYNIAICSNQYMYPFGGFNGSGNVMESNYLNTVAKAVCNMNSDATETWLNDFNGCSLSAAKDCGTYQKNLRALDSRIFANEKSDGIVTKYCSVGAKNVVKQQTAPTKGISESAGIYCPSGAAICYAKGYGFGNPVSDCVCYTIDSYKDFILSHQSELKQYNFFRCDAKTETCTKDTTPIDMSVPLKDSDFSKTETTTDLFMPLENDLYSGSTKTEPYQLPAGSEPKVVNTPQVQTSVGSQQVTCTSGYVYNPVSGECEDVSYKGAGADVSCGSDYEYNPFTNECVRISDSNYKPEPVKAQPKKAKPKPVVEETKPDGVQIISSGSIYPVKEIIEESNAVNRASEIMGPDYICSGARQHGTEVLCQHKTDKSIYTTVQFAGYKQSLPDSYNKPASKPTPTVSGEDAGISSKVQTIVKDWEDGRESVTHKLVSFRSAYGDIYTDDGKLVDLCSLDEDAIGTIARMLGRSGSMVYQKNKSCFEKYGYVIESGRIQKK